MKPRDEQLILESVEARDEALDVRQSWLTPAGRRRRIPLWECCLENGYLRVARAVKGHDRHRVEQKARQQLEAWKEREVRERLAEAKRDIEYKAIHDTQTAEAEIGCVRSCLGAGLEVELDEPDWDALLLVRRFLEELFDWCKPIPVRPEKRLWERVWRRAYTRRLLTYERAMQAVKQDKAHHQALHDASEARRKARYESAAERKNAAIEDFKEGLEAAAPQAVVEALGMFFERETYPVRLTPEPRVHWVPGDEALLVDLHVPAPDELSKIEGYKAQERYMRVAPVLLKAPEHASLYDEGLKQLALRALHGVFAVAPAAAVHTAVVNAWTSFQDPDTEQDETFCLLSVRADRDEFTALKLDEVDATECLQALAARLSGSLAELTPVRPILCVEHDVASLVGSGVRDFEGRVRDVLARMFPGEETELRVETSGGGEVDGLVVDADPIRGGTFLVRARRSKQAVLASEVRDFHAAMREADAAQGVFLAASRFDSESRAFARGRPLVLIDGPGWVCLTEAHGDDPSRRSGVGTRTIK